MTKIEKYVICLFILGALAFIGKEWMVAHDDLKQAQATIALNEQQHKQEIQTLQTQLEAIKHDQTITKTPAQIVSKLPSYIPLPAPLVSTRTGDSGAPPIITIPPQDLQPLFTFATDCQACKLQHQTDIQTIAELTKERDEALKVAKGGSFIRRVWKGAKIFGIGLGVGLAIGVAHGI